VKKPTTKKMVDTSEDVATVDQYLWLVVVGTFFGFIYAFGIGANDVANAFASTVASKSLTLKQAITAAAIFEFSGAYFLGAHVTNTIRSKIFDVSLYDDEPQVIILGMFTSITTATIVLLVATYMELPVSTTHTMVGSIMGFSIAAKGFDSIDWDVVSQIFISWLVSPLVSGILAYGFFYTIRSCVLQNENAFERAYYTFPIVLFFGVGIDMFFVLNKSTSNLKSADSNTYVLTTLGIACASGIIAALLWVSVLGPICKRRVEALLEEPDATPVSNGTRRNGRSEQAVDKQSNDEEANEYDIDNDTLEKDEDRTDVGNSSSESAPNVDEPKAGFAKMAQTFADNTYNQDLQAITLAENQRAAEIWNAGEVYDPHTEQLFTYIQVFTACLNSFAHGANDVANAIAPISAMVQIYQSGGLVQSNSRVDRWILAYGGIGIVIGLVFYGYRVMKSLGYKMTMLSPSRGASAELAASLFVVTASFMSIPVSSTQSICGAVMGVGCVGGFKNVQWSFFLIICTGWVIIFISASIISAGAFSMFAFTPSLSER
jgi:solute carrier family 20 (sodium-dependent phosphate transporter)